MTELEIPSVWIELQNKTKKVMIVQLYREFKQVGITVSEENNSPTNQLNRLLNFLSHWEEAIATYDDVVVMGDINLDHERLALTAHPLRQLSEVLLDRLSLLNVRQLVTVDTWSNGKVSRCLDHIYISNDVEIESVNSVHSTSSDHTLVTAIINLKSVSTRKSPCHLSLSAILCLISPLIQLQCFFFMTIFTLGQQISAADSMAAVSI